MTQKNEDINVSIDELSILDNTEIKDEIDSLKVSNKTKKLLYKYGIHNLQQLNELDLEDFKSFKAVGLKTYLEVKKLLNELNIHQPSKKLIEYSRNNLSQLDLYPIEILRLSTRPYSRLKGLGVNTLQELAMFNMENLENVNGFGSKSIIEVDNKFKRWIEENKYVIEETDNSNIYEFYSAIKEKLEAIIQISKHEVFLICKNNEIENKDLNDTIINFLNTKEIIQLIKQTFIKEYPDLIVEKNKLEEKLSMLNLNEDNFSIKNYYCKYIVDSLNDYYILKNESIESYMKHKYEEDKENNLILYKRIIEDNSLQEIAQIKKVSRERIRQIANRKIKDIPIMREDCYKSVYEYFNFNELQFLGVFKNETFITFNYLFTKFKKGKIVLSKENVNRYTGYFKEEIMEYLERSEEKYNRIIITMNVLMNEFEALPYNIFEEKYYKFIKEKELNIDKFRLNSRTIGNHLRAAKYIVFNSENKFRYIDIDYEEFCKAIDLSKYKHSLISSDLAYRENMELMNEFDIRDGHELFYVLKVSQKLNLLDQYNVDFRRVPTIIFDDMSDESQLISFLKENSPISVKDFYQLYEERFGLKKESIIGNFSRYLSEYLVGNNYVIDAPLLNEKDSEILKLKLNIKPMWFVSEIEDLIDLYCDESAKNAINFGALRKIGYDLYPSGYVISNKYAGAYDYFEKDIFNKNLVDTTKLDKRITNLSIFESFLDKKKEKLEIIEIDKKVFYSIDYFCQLYSVNKEELLDIQNEMLNWCTEKYFNGYSIRNKIKDSKLIPEKLKHAFLINLWLVGSFMGQKEGISSLKNLNFIILSRKSDALCVPFICKWLERDSGKLTLSQLSHMFNETFGCDYDKTKLAERIRCKGMWNEIINDSLDSYIDEMIEKVSLDEDELFEESFY